ncbi:helix-turn-helix domain-containing protein [Enterovibrio sp. 27052020O]|uniref:helix-turn-helix domain-containing protein n=1 Tax=Enterovibrio sp. 27052020O TaxID=3241166 RepID=UPI00389114A1
MFSHYLGLLAKPFVTFIVLAMLITSPISAFASAIFYAFPHSSKEQSSNVVDVEYIPNHGVWLLDSDGNVSFYDGIHYHSLSEFITLPSYPITRISAFDNSLWFIANSALLRYDIASNTLDIISLGDGVSVTDIVSDQHYLWVSTTSNLFRIPLAASPAENLGHMPLARLFEGQNSVIGMSESAFVDISTGNNIYEMTENRLVNAAYESDNTLWVGSQEGLVLITDGVQTSHFIKSVSVNVIAQTSEGVWVGTDNGLYLGTKTDNSHIQFDRVEGEIDDAYSLSGEQVFDIETSRSGDMWLSTENALNYRSPVAQSIHRFPLHRLMPDWESASISSLVTLRDKHYLSAKNKLVVLDKELIPTQSTKLNLVIEGMSSLSDTLWIASASGLMALDPDTLLPIENMSPSGLDNVPIDHVIADTHSLWLVSGGLVFRYWPASKTLIDFGVDWSVPPNAQLNAVLDLDERGTWLGTSEGLLFYFDGQFQSKLTRETIGSIKSISAGSGDTLWLLTGRGVFKYKMDGTAPPQQVFSSDIDASAKCLALSDHAAFIVTTKGIYRIDLASSQKHFIKGGDQATSSASLRHFCRLENQAMLIAGEYGVFSLSSEMLEALFEAPLRKYSIGSVSVNGKPWRLGATQLDAISVPSKSSLMIDIGKMPFGKHESIEYRLDGTSDGNWYTTNEQRLLFSALVSGRYTLMIREPLQGGETLERPLVLLDVAAPWYERLGYVLLVALVIGAVAIGYYRRKTTIVKAHNVQLRHTVHQKVIEIDRRQSLAKDLDRSGVSIVQQRTIEHPAEHPIKAVLDNLPNEELIQDETIQAEEEAKEWRDRVLKEIAVHFHDPDYSPAVLAKSLFISERSLQRRFKVELGYTFKEALISTRLSNAKRMLSQGDKITNVAVACGFNEPSYFTKSFKAKYGYTPSQFRELLEGEDV